MWRLPVQLLAHPSQMLCLLHKQPFAWCSGHLGTENAPHQIQQPATLGQSMPHRRACRTRMSGWPLYVQCAAKQEVHCLLLVVD